MRANSGLRLKIKNKNFSVQLDKVIKSSKAIKKFEEFFGQTVDQALASGVDVRELYEFHHGYSSLGEDTPLAWAWDLVEPSEGVHYTEVRFSKLETEISDLTHEIRTLKTDLRHLEDKVLGKDDVW